MNRFGIFKRVFSSTTSPNPYYKLQQPQSINELQSKRWIYFDRFCNVVLIGLFAKIGFLQLEINEMQMQTYLLQKELIELQRIKSNNNSS
jgi:hypothetical protein